MSAAVRVRFAPSPTGFLHIGGARTALFNWLYAKATGGKFLLRIEDTDRERSEERFTQDIQESLRWLGLDWDEPPVFQSARFDRYKVVAEEMVSRGLAYRCDCTPQMLDALRAQYEKEKKPFRYPGTCREKKSVGPNSVIRIKNPGNGETAFEDLIRGHISFSNKDIDDWVILRNTGAPMYNFVVVIDDYDQKITHILRGDDHINNTPKQILLYQALGYPVPHFAHLPMILGADKTKLSKRHGAASTLEYRTMGYLPGALVNFLVRLGWSHGDQEIFSVEELQKYFSLDHIGKASAVFNIDKLNWISGHYFREIPAKELQSYLKTYFADQIRFCESLPDEKIVSGISIIQAKVKLIPELIDQLRVLFGEDPDYTTATTKKEDLPKIRAHLETMQPVLESCPFLKEQLEETVKAKIEALGQKLSPYAQAIRFAVTGGKVSPGLFEMLEVQGKEVVLRRITNALKYLSAVHG